MSGVIWVLVAVALAIGEVLTPGLFFLGPVALAAAAAALAALLGAGTLGSLIVFIVCSVASCSSCARSRAAMSGCRRCPGPEPTRSSASQASSRAASTAHGGRVRIGGEEWSARSYLDDDVFAEGQTVDVVQIEGATALVAE